MRDVDSKDEDLYCSSSHSLAHVLDVFSSEEESLKSLVAYFKNAGKGRGGGGKGLSKQEHGEIKRHQSNGITAAHTQTLTKAQPLYITVCCQ